MSEESKIEWREAASALPDEEMTVLISLSDGEVWTGFVDAGEWRYVSGDRIEGSWVMDWAEFPEPPAVGCLVGEIGRGLI